MSSRPHYFAIGLFVLTATALALLGIIAFSVDSLRSPGYFLETYVDESVQGIDVGTPFKFRGVKVGNVSEIALVSSEYETEKMYVMIRVALSDKEMLAEADTIPLRVMREIRRGLRIKLVPQGITGLSFVEAEYYPETDARALDIDWEPKYTYIPSTPAVMTLLSRTVEHLTADLNTLDIKAIGDHIEGLSSNLNLAATELPAMSSNLNVMVETLGDIVSGSDEDVDLLLNNLRYITEDTRELIRMLRRHPGMLLTAPPEDELNR